MKNQFWTSEKLMSISAMIIGIGTLIVFIYQTKLIREQQHMSVYPHLNVQMSYTTDLEYKLVNKGIGPAIISSIKIVNHKGKEFDDPIDFFNWMLKEKKLKFQYTYSNINKGDLISEKDELTIISIKNPDREKVQLFLNALKIEFSEFEIQYKSIYGEKWMINKELNSPLKIE